MMPSYTKFRTFLPLLCLSLVLSATNAKADIIVDVDMSDLSAVTFTTTEALAEGSFTGLTANGVTLKNFSLKIQQLPLGKTSTAQFLFLLPRTEAHGRP